MTDLEKLLRDKQDELRGRPLDWIDVVKERLDRSTGPTWRSRWRRL